MRRCVKSLVCAMGVFLFLIHAAVAQKPGDSKRLIQSFPIPPGQEATGIRFPYKENGKMKMFFNVDKMFRKDVEQSVDLSTTKLPVIDLTTSLQRQMISEAPDTRV